MKGRQKVPVSKEVADYQAQVQELFLIDWDVQVAGFAEAYTLTGDTDYELMRVEAQARADRQAVIVNGIVRLELLNKK